MVSYGICQNAVCSLGYLNPSLDRFRRRVLAAGHAIGQSNPYGTQRPEQQIESQVSDWQNFVEFFQRGAVCSACGKPLYSAIQPTDGIDEEERKRLVKLNGLLDLARQLQSWGILRVRAW
jgi:hypothetical protein